jgi:hypothetical protein
MSRLVRLHARFDRYGVNEWAACAPDAPPGATSQHNCELEPDGYTRLFKLLKAAAPRQAAALAVLGAGCGRSAAHAVASGIFRRADGVEIVPARVRAAAEALRDLRLADRVTVAEGNFCDAGYSIAAPCAFSFDVAFDRATLAQLAPKLEAATGCAAFVSFKPPGRWAAAGLRSYELQRSARVKTSGEERFTFFLYTRRR